MDTDTPTSILSNLDSIVNQLSFILCAMLGGMAHWLKKVVKHETEASFHEWFGEANLPTTIYTFIVFFFVIIGCLAANIVDEHTGFWAALYTGFATGFGVDAGFNADGKSLTADISTIKAGTGALFGSQPQPGAPPMQAPVEPTSGDVGSVSIGASRDEGRHAA